MTRVPIYLQKSPGQMLALFLVCPPRGSRTSYCHLARVLNDLYKINFLVVAVNSQEVCSDIRTPSPNQSYWGEGMGMGGNSPSGVLNL